jgi:hypothetical protein
MKIGDRVIVKNARVHHEDANGHTGTIVGVREHVDVLPVEYGCMEDGKPFSTTTVYYIVNLDEAVVDENKLDRDGYPVEFSQLSFVDSELELI